MMQTPLISPSESSAAASTARRPFRLSIVPMAIIIVVVLFIGGFGVALWRSGLQQLSGGPAPDFTLTTFDGQPFTLSAQHGKIVLINFWASWCGPCRDEASTLDRLWSDYKSRGVVFLGIDYLDNRSDASAFLQQYHIAYPVAPDDGTHISGAYRVKGVPETYLVDQRGIIATNVLVPLDKNSEQQIRDQLDQLLAGTGTGKS